MKHWFGRMSLMTLLSCSAFQAFAVEGLGGGNHRAKQLALGICNRAQVMSARVMGGEGGFRPNPNNPWDHAPRFGMESDDAQEVGEENDMLAAQALLTISRDYATIVTLIDYFTASGNWDFQITACQRVRTSILKTNQAKQLLFVPGPSGLLQPFEFESLVNDERQILFALGC